MFCHTHKGYQVQLHTYEQSLPLIFYPVNFCIALGNEQNATIYIVTMKCQKNKE